MGLEQRKLLIFARFAERNCRKKLQKEKKTLEGESPLLKDGALSLQTSLSHRELPHKTPAIYEAKIPFAFV